MIKAQKVESLTCGTCIKKNHMIMFLMQLYASRNIHFLYIITFLISLLKELQVFPTLKKILSLKIRLRCIISDNNEVHIARELGSQEFGIQLHFPSWFSTSI